MVRSLTFDKFSLTFTRLAVAWLSIVIVFSFQQRLRTPPDLMLTSIVLFTPLALPVLGCCFFAGRLAVAWIPLVFTTAQGLVYWHGVTINMILNRTLERLRVPDSAA